MFTLSYSPAYDPYNTIFRFVSLLSSMEASSIQFEKLRIVDFFLCFPSLLSEIKGSRKVPSFTKSRNALVKKYPVNKYEVLPRSTFLFDNMEHIQMAALGALLTSNSVSTDGSRENRIAVESLHFSVEIDERILEFSSTHQDLISFLINDLTHLDYLGNGGIKDKTGLGEFRYDVV